MSLQIDFFDAANQKIASSIEFGSTFFHNNLVCMRVKPINWLLNSTLMVDAINRGKVFCVNLEKGTLFCIEGSTLVEPVIGKLSIKRN